MAEKLKIIPLGGLNEIGKNITVLEYGKDMIVVDCGVGFPEEDMYGVDLVIPDFTYLVKNQGKLRGFFITHGHEDHIGSLPYALQQVLAELRAHLNDEQPLDLMMANYVYEHVEDNTTLTVRYTNVFPQNRLFNWTHVGHFRPDQNILMHSVMYRTEVLRKCGMVLPKHTFYVDNIFVYQPLPYVKSMYYMDLDLYRYFIGRADQSVNESIMVKRVDQQLRVTRHMIDCQDLDELKDQKRLHAYMVHYLSVMMAVSDIFLLLDGSDEAKAKRTGLWQYLKDHVSTGVYRAVRYNLGGLTDLKFPGGDKLTLGVYRQLRKVFKFN